MNQKISSRVKATMARASNFMYDAQASVTREVETETATGKGLAPEVIYTGLDIKLNAQPHQKLPTDMAGEMANKRHEAFALIPLTILAGDPLVPTPVAILTNDLITVDGQQWTVDANQDPATGYQVRQRIRVFRDTE